MEADDIKYKDSEGNSVTQDLGYGFIGTEEHFSSSVPNGTDKILVNVTGEVALMGSIWKVILFLLTEKPMKRGSYPSGSWCEQTDCNMQRNVGKARTYTIDVTRRTASKQTTFEVPEGASVLVMQGSKMKANEDGTYTLENGTYTYYVSKSGFLTKTDSFKVTDEEKIRLSVWKA